uniref:Uncharacterized protein n=1 Tax=Rhizophora mucronata TaxID=61149 RepID=A0A2P2KLL1_RHIMU
MQSQSKLNQIPLHEEEIQYPRKRGKKNPKLAKKKKIIKKERKS